MRYDNYYSSKAMNFETNGSFLNAGKKLPIMCASLLVAILLVVPFALVSLPTSAAYTAPVNLSNDSYQAHYPWIANSGNHLYVTWTEEIHGIYFRSSSDGGSTWSPLLTSPATLLSIKQKGYGVANYPIVYANGTDVYVVWSQTVNTSGVNVLQIFIAVSTNSGASFFPAVQLTSGSSTNGWITPVIAASGSNVYVAYTGNGKNSYVTWSNNYGAAGSWHAPLLYATTHEPQIAAWGNNA
ncbi:MAG: hypothetical protein ACHQ1H_11365, partial [Nitrososphaerales archaeon]